MVKAIGAKAFKNPSRPGATAVDAIVSLDDREVAVEVKYRASGFIGAGQLRFIASGIKSPYALIVSNVKLSESAEKALVELNTDDRKIRYVKWDSADDNDDLRRTLQDLSNQ